MDPAEDFESDLGLHSKSQFEIQSDPRADIGYAEDQMEAMSIHLSPPPVFTFFEFAFTIVTSCLYLIDTGLDLYLAWGYYQSGWMTYFGLTLGFVIGPAVLVTFCSVLLYISDSQNPRVPKPSICQKLLRCIFSLLQLGPLLRDLNVLTYGMRSVLALRKFDSRAQEKYYDFVLLEQSDSAFLRLFERFLEAAPQVILQVFIIFYHMEDSSTHFGGVVQLISISTSVMTLAWALAVFNTTRRNTTPGKKRLTFWGRTLQFLWHFCMISSRVVTLALFTSIHPTLTAPLCAFRWVLMLAWLTCQETQINEDLQKESRASCVDHFSKKFLYAFVYIFALFNSEEKPRRLKYDLFYLVYFVENSLLLISCVYSTMTFSVILSSVVSHALFLLGFTFMCVYFKWCHPSMRFPTFHKALSHWVGLKY